MPDWLDSRLSAEVRSWEVPPARPRAALYRRPSASRRSGRLVVAMAAAALAAALGSIQAGAVPGVRVMEIASRMAEERPALPISAPTPVPVPSASASAWGSGGASGEAAAAYIPPAPSRGITKVAPAPGERPDGRPSAPQAPHSDGRGAAEEHRRGE